MAFHPVVITPWVLFPERFGTLSELADESGGPIPGHAAAARDWLHDYVCRPDARLAREGAVCPFVPPSMEAGTLRFEVWPVTASPAGLDALIARMLEVFDATRWAHRNRTLHALLVVLDGLPGDAGSLAALDAAQARAKPGIVEKGLMISQFHPLCDESAARNPEFKALRAPVPMLALRHMALHDIVFLNTDARWFSEYESRFGVRYDRGSVQDPLFREVFARARERFSPPAPVPGAR